MIERNRRGFVAHVVLGCVLVTLLAGVALLRSTAARAASIPDDPAAHGFVGLCGIDGKTMTGGSIFDKPFVWKAIGSQPAQAEAQGPGAVATLYAYQPRPGVAASQWSGDTLTATNTYSTPSAPTAQATKLDFRLKDFMDEYPPMVDGLYELRMYYGNHQAPVYSDQYAATFIQVSGDDWKVVQGGNVNCGKGNGVSSELGALGTKSAGGTPTASAPFGGPSGTGVAKNAQGVPVSGGVTGSTDAGSSGRSGNSHGAASSGTSAATGASTRPSSAVTAGGTTSSGDAASPAAAASTASASASSGGGSSAWVVLVIVIVVVLAAGGGWFAYRRMRT